VSRPEDSGKEQGIRQKSTASSLDTGRPSVARFLWLRSPVLLGLLFLVGSRVVFSQPDSEEDFSERLNVTERTVYVDDLALPRMDSTFRRSRADFLVRIDGAPAELVDSAAEDPPNVTHLVWLDSDLASHSALAAAATQLATAFQSFPETEVFTLVEADRQAPPLQESLSRTELVLRLQRFAARTATTPEPAPTLEPRIAALNRMAVAVSRYRSGDLGALWLAAEPWAVDPRVFEEISRSGAEEVLSPTTLGALQRTSRILASYGWVLFPVWGKSGGPTEELRIPAREDQSREFLEQGLGLSTRQDSPLKWLRVWLFGAGSRHMRSRQSLNLTRALDLATEVRLAPMAMVARATSGGLAGDSSRIEGLASRLRSRRPLVVHDSTTVGAELRRLEVVWLGGDGRAVPALPWAASLTPPELGVARLLSVVETASSAPTGAPLRLRPADTGAGLEPALCFAYPRDRGALRLLWWSAAERQIQMGQPTAVPQAPEESDSECVPLPQNLQGADYVQREALNSLDWGAAQLSRLAGAPP
jgi:hypothetical protein